MKKTRMFGEMLGTRTTVGIGQREDRGSSSQVFRLKLELRFHSVGSEEPETRIEQERKIPELRCVVGLGGQGGQYCHHYPVGVKLSRPGPLQGTGGGALLVSQKGPPPGWHGAQGRDRSLQGSGLPAVPALKTGGSFQKSKDSSQLGLWSMSKTNRKRSQWSGMAPFFVWRRD